MPYAPIMPNKTNIVKNLDMIDNIAIYSYHEGTKKAQKGLPGCDPVNQSSSSALVSEPHKTPKKNETP